MSKELTTIANIPTTAPELNISAMSASITITSTPDGDAITVKTNYPEHWSADGAKVKQTEISNAGGGVFSGGVFNGGTVSGVVIGSIGGGSFVSTGRRNRVGGTHIDSIGNGEVVIGGRKFRGNKVSIINGTVYIDGKEVDLNADQPASEKTEQQELDRLEVTIPKTFRGDLRLSAGGQSQIQASELGSFKRVRLELKGQSHADVGSILALDGVKLNISGQSGLTGSFLSEQSVEIDLSGQSSGRLNSVIASELNIDASGQSGLHIRNGSAVSGTVDASGMSNVSLTGRFSGLDRSVSGMADISIS